jgi:hypothetical protein
VLSGRLVMHRRRKLPGSFWKSRVS